MTWKESLIGLPLAVLGAVLLLLTAAAMMLTRTDWGRERVRAYAIDQLNSAIQGHVEIDAVLEGDLLSQVRLAGVRIHESDGRPFALVDTVALHYRWSDFLFGNITVAKVTLSGPVVQIRVSPEGRWNFEEIFSGTGAPKAKREGDDSRGRQIILREVTIQSGDVTLRMPWELGPDDDPDSTRWFVEPTDGGWQRVFRLEDFDASLPIARVVAPEEGRLFHIGQLSAAASVIGEPFEIEQLRADLEVHGDTLAFDLWEAELPASSLFGEGWVSLSSPLRYDLTLHGNPVTTTDLNWLLPQLPPGRARLEFGYRSLSAGTALEASNARWESADARVSGRFAMTLTGRPDGLRFDRVNLDIERANHRMIQMVTGWAPPDSGEIRGRLQLDGPLSELDVDADLEAQQWGAEKPSRVTVSGTARVGGDVLGAEGLRVGFDTLHLDLVRTFLPEVSLRGLITGWGELNGRLAKGLDFRFDIEQRDGDFTPNHLAGSGTFLQDSGVPTRLAVDAGARSISLTTLAQYYPAIPFRGDFRGDLSMRGPLNDLDVGLRLVGAGDSLRVLGVLELGESTRYSGEVQGWRIRLAEFRERLPRSDLDFHAHFEGQGVNLDELRGRARLEVFASFVGGVGIDSAWADLNLADRRLVIDSAAVGGDFGELRTSGAFSLTDEISDSLRLELSADSLGALNPWLFPTRGPSVVPALLNSAAASQGDTDDGIGLEGSAHLSGWLFRRQGQLGLSGAIEAAGVVYGGWSADSLRVESLAVSTGMEPSAQGQLLANGLGLGGLRFEHLQATGTFADSLAKVRFDLEKVDAAARGRGWVRLTDVTEIGLDTLSLELGGSAWVLTDSALIQLDESGAWSIPQIELESGARRAALTGSVGTSGPASLELHLAGVDVGDVSRLWSDSVGVAGELVLDAVLSGRVRDPTFQGSFEVTDGHALGVRFSEFRGEFGFGAGELTLDASVWREGSRLVRLDGTLPVDLELPEFGVTLPERAMDLVLEGDSIPLGLATLFTDQVASVRGSAAASVKIFGTPSDVLLQGTARLSAGAFRVVRTGIVYDGMSGELLFKGNTVQIREVTFRGGSAGRGTLAGAIDFTTMDDPEFGLRLEVRQLPAYDQLDARMVVSGQVALNGPYRQPVVSGDLSVVSGVLFIEEIGRQSEIIDPFKEGMALFDTLFARQQGLQPGRENPFIGNLTMDLSIRVERDTWLRSEEANVEIGGELDVQMRRAENQLRVDGTLEAIRGEYRMFNKRFEVVEGTIEFVGVPAMNPNLRIVARYTVRTQKEPIEIRLIIGGTLENMTLSLESDQEPPIPESELLSYLLFGRPSYELTRTSEESNLLQDVTSGVPQAFFGYALGSLLVGETGIAYIDVSRAPLTPDTEGEYRSSVGLAFEATQVEVGWYLAPTVFISVAQHLIGAVRPTVRLEWRLDERLTLRGVTEPRFGQEATLFYGSPDTDLDQSIGLFLLYGWAY